MTRATLACVRCTAQIATGRLCSRCLGKLLAILGDYAGPPAHGTGPKGTSLDLLRDADVVIAKQSRAGDSAGHSIGHAQPLPLNAWTVEQLDRATGSLCAWWRVWAEVAQETRAALDCPAMAQDLIRGRLWLASFDAIDELVADLTRDHARLRNAVDRPRPALYLGPCHTVTEDAELCPGDVYARGDDAPTCDRCRSTYARDDLVAWINDRAQDTLVTATEAARALSAWGPRITADLVRSWASRKRLVAHGTTPAGEPTYRFGDIRAMALTHTPRKDTA